MNSEQLDSSGTDQQSPVPARKRRGWWSRNWLWFVPVLLVALIAFCAAWGYWSFFGRVYSLDEYCSAMELIEGSERLQASLGEPIQSVGWPPPSCRLEQREREVRWEVEGPNGRAKAHVLARKMRGNWEFVIMEVALPDGEKVSLVEKIDGTGEAPLFDGPGPKSEPPPDPRPDAPPPVIDMPTPDVPLPGGD